MRSFNFSRLVDPARPRETPFSAPIAPINLIAISITSLFLSVILGNDKKRRDLDSVVFTVVAPNNFLRAENRTPKPQS